MNIKLIRLLIVGCILFVSFSFMASECLNVPSEALNKSMEITNSSGKAFQVHIYNADDEEVPDSQKTIEDGETKKIWFTPDLHNTARYVILKDKDPNGNPIVFCWETVDGTFTRKLYYRKSGYNIHCNSGCWIQEDMDCNKGCGGE